MENERTKVAVESKDFTWHPHNPTPPPPPKYSVLSNSKFLLPWELFSHCEKIVAYLLTLTNLPLSYSLYEKTKFLALKFLRFQRHRQFEG